MLVQTTHTFHSLPIVIRPFQTSMTPGGSKNKKAYTPASPRSAKTARAERASRRTSGQHQSSTGAGMSSASINDDIQVVGEEADHIEPEVIIQSRDGGSRPVPGAGSGTADPPQSDSGQQLPPDRSQSAPPRGSNESSSGGDSNPHVSGQNVGNASNVSASSPQMPPSEGAGDIRPETSRTDSSEIVRERAVFTALELIEEANDTIQIAGSVRLTGQSKTDTKRLLKT